MNGNDCGGVVQKKPNVYQFVATMDINKQNIQDTAFLFSLNIHFQANKTERVLRSNKQFSSLAPKLLSDKKLTFKQQRKEINYIAVNNGISCDLCWLTDFRTIPCVIIVRRGSRNGKGVGAGLKCSFIDHS